MPIRLCGWVLCVCLLFGCQQTAPLESFTETAVVPPPVTNTVVPPTSEPIDLPTPTSVPPTPIPPTPEPVLPTATPTPTPEPAFVLTLDVLRNMSYPTTFVEMGTINLEDGQFEQSILPDSAIRASARLSDKHAFGNLDDGDNSEAAVILATNTGGTGVFYELYVVGCESPCDSAESQPTILANTFLGDRIVVRDIAIADNAVILDVTRQGRGDPLCCPSEEAQYIYQLTSTGVELTTEIITTREQIATAGQTVDAFMQTYLQDPTGMSSVNFVTNALRERVEAGEITTLTGITEPVSSYFYGIHQRSATDVTVKTTLNQSVQRNMFFDLVRENDSWSIVKIEPARAATTPLSAEPCRLTLQNEMVAWERPSAQGNAFGRLPANTEIVISAETVTGWFGFEPGVAQATNTGVFRFRWLPPDDAFALSESCDNLPLVVAIQPQLCYTMPLQEVVVRDSADASASIIGSLPANVSFAAVTALADGWAQVDLLDSSLFRNVKGWISAEMLNLNGTGCNTVLNN